MKSEPPLLPCPGVRFEPDYLQRVDALHTRLEIADYFIDKEKYEI